MKKYYIAALVITIALIVGIAHADQMTFSTYYPAPFGVYREMRIMRVAIGDTYHKAGDHPWDEDGNGDPGEIYQDADLVVEGRVGIGTTEPNTQLDINGWLRTYSDVAGAWSYITTNADDWDPNLKFTSYDYNYTIKLDDSDSGKLRFMYNDIASETMVLDQSGRVGIGTTDPQAKLDVSGISKCEVALLNPIDPDAEPTSSMAKEDGMLICDSTDNKIKQYDESANGGDGAWMPLGGGGGVFTYDGITNINLHNIYSGYVPGTHGWATWDLSPVIGANKRALCYIRLTGAPNFVSWVLGDDTHISRQYISTNKAQPLNGTAIDEAYLITMTGPTGRLRIQCANSSTATNNIIFTLMAYAIVE